MSIKRVFLLEVIDRKTNKTIVGPVERKYSLGGPVMDVVKFAVDEFKKELNLEQTNTYQYKYDCVEVTDLINQPGISK